MNELKPCPNCKGQVTLYVNIERGVFARCKQCKSEFEVCTMAEAPTYGGTKIRKSTVQKIIKKWNRRATDER